MAAEEVLLAEASAAERAAVGPAAAVDELVRLEVPGGGETLVAQPALVRLVLVVGHLVVVQVAGGGEPLGDSVHQHGNPARLGFPINAPKTFTLQLSMSV